MPEHMEKYKGTSARCIDFPTSQGQGAYGVILLVSSAYATDSARNCGGCQSRASKDCMFEKKDFP